FPESPRGLYAHEFSTDTQLPRICQLRAALWPGEVRGRKHPWRSGASDRGLATRLDIQRFDRIAIERGCHDDNQSNRNTGYRRKLPSERTAHLGKSIRKFLLANALPRT